MPVELIAFTADRRIRGLIPLADDRVSDMLNSVSRVIVRAAEIGDIVASTPTPTQTADVTLAAAAKDFTRAS